MRRSRGCWGARRRPREDEIEGRAYHRASRREAGRRERCLAAARLVRAHPIEIAAGRTILATLGRDLVVGDRNGKADVFVHDLLTGRTIIVSVAGDGGQANGDSFVSGISADGRVLAFTSLADNIVSDDHNSRKDVFVAVLRKNWAAKFAPARETRRGRGPRLVGR